MISFWSKPICFLFLATIWLGVNSVQGQARRNFLKIANQFFQLENYRAAIPYYEQVLNEDNENALVLFRAGISYLAYDKDRASDYLYKAQRLKPNVAPDVEYWLGRVDHVNYRFDDAVDHYRLYANTLPKNAAARQAINILIEQSRNAQKMVQHPKDLFVRNLGPTINSPYSDHSPVISRDNKALLYTTRSRAALPGKVNPDGAYVEEIVGVTRQDEDNWSGARSINRHLNSQGHDASIQLFNNDTQLLLYRKIQNGDFYVSSKTNNAWGLPVKIGAPINTKDYESDAFITPDGKTFYFATTHLSKRGDKDLYVSYKNSQGSWSKPQNLGQILNTPFDEDSPFLAPDGNTLYFTSRGHNTMGGYDVFRSQLDSVKRTWSAPENLGYPINSPDDDTYFRLNAEGTTAYLSSYRMGGYGEKDLWSVDLSKEVIIQGRVAYQENNVAPVELEVNFSSQPKNNKALQYWATTSDTGAFEVRVQSGRSYQVTFSLNAKILGIQTYEVPATVADKVVLKPTFSMAPGKKAGEAFVR